MQYQRTMRLNRLDVSMQLLQGLADRAQSDQPAGKKGNSHKRQNDNRPQEIGPSKRWARGNMLPGATLAMRPRFERWVLGGQ